MKRQEQQRGVTIMRLTLFSCRFIEGDVVGPQTRYCGEKTHKGPYCLKHHKRCYKDTPPLSRRLTELK